MTLRMPCAQLKPVNLAVNSLFFSDGSQKCLAAFIVWVSLALAAELDENAADLERDSVQALAASLLRIRTVVKSSLDQAGEIDGAIARIVKQNVDARVQPVSSLTWCSILRALGDDTSFEMAISKYNSHPEVIAFEASGGAGVISLDNKKRQVWLKK